MAGLHAAAHYVEHHSALDVLGTVLTVAIPVAVYVLCEFALSFALTRTADPLHLLLVAGSALVVVASSSWWWRGRRWCGASSSWR